MERFIGLVIALLLVTTSSALQPCQSDWDTSYYTQIPAHNTEYQIVDANEGERVFGEIEADMLAVKLQIMESVTWNPDDAIVSETGHYLSFSFISDKDTRWRIGIKNDNNLSQGVTIRYSCSLPNTFDISEVNDSIITPLFFALLLIVPFALLRTKKGRNFFND
ncbi:MAG: hypothetical protein ACFFF4_00610 [Candidatus Thorarchaeota archaeon]